MPQASKQTTSLDVGWELCSEEWLSGSGQPRRLGFSTLEWLPARVPGHVHWDLVRHGVIQDPNQGLGELGCQWVDETVWLYRLRFEFKPDEERPRRILRFNGLDTCCTVLLNGERIADHDNMFVALEVDVSSSLREGENLLTVRFEPAARVGRRRRAAYFGTQGLPSDVARFDERAFVRKAQYMFAWDWGPRLVSAGLWKPVELLEFSSRILDVRSMQEHLSDGRVRVSFSSRTEGEGRVRHCIAGHWLDDGASLVIDEPELWWPAGMGAPALYAVESVLLAPDGLSDGPDSVPLDRRTMRLGLRTIALERKPDELGESFSFLVNRQPLWALGANWIPDHSYPSTVTDASLRSQLERALDLRMNMLRVWGGGVYESDAFYDLCDELGILVWQDFPFACSYVPDGEFEQRALMIEAKENIERLRNHASLALWCGNNENLTMWQSKWDRPRPQPPRYFGQVLYDAVLPEAVRTHDGDRPYVPSSPIGGDNANDGGVGDQHYWDVWHGRGDYVHYRDSTARFASEFGFASAPSPAAWRKAVPSSADWRTLPVRHPVARWHDKTGKGYETFLGYVSLHYPDSKNLEEWTYYSQLNQRDAVRFAIEHYRKSEFCRGSLIWQLNDCWPAQSWAVLDSTGSYKAAAFELRRLYSSTLLAVEHSPGSSVAQVWAVRDNHRHGVSGVLSVEVRALATGATTRGWRQDLTVRPGERKRALTLDLSGCSLKESLLWVSFGEVATERLLCEPKEAQVAEPALSVVTKPGGVVVRTSAPVVDLWLWDEAEPVAFAQNFVTRPTAGEWFIPCDRAPERLAARSLFGRHDLA